MRNTPVLILAVVALLCPSIALGGLIVNGDFEANFTPNYASGTVQIGGPINGWTVAPGPGTYCGGDPCFGLWNSEEWLEYFDYSRGIVAFFGDEGDFIAQQIPTTAGASYILSAWLTNIIDPGPPNSFGFWWNGSLVGSLTNAGLFGWTRYSYVVTATDTLTEVRFGGSNVPGGWGLDGVDVSPTPEPASLLLFGTALSALVVSRFRRPSARPGRHL